MVHTVLEVGQVDLEQIAVWPDDEGGWFASNNEGRGFDFHGDTLNDAITECVNNMGSCDIGGGE